MASVLSLADAKTHLNITVTTYDTELQAVIDSAEATLANHVGPLQATSVTARVRPTGGCALVLPILPAISLTSVTPYAAAALTLADLHLETASGVVTYNSGLDFSAAYYDVVYSAGWSTCPNDLVFAIKELVRHLWTTQRGEARRPGSAQAAEPPPGAAHALPYRVAELIAPHIQPGFA